MARYNSLTFELVARLIRDAADLFNHCEHDPICQKTAVLVALSAAFSAEFQKDNKAFKPEKFAEACFPSSRKEQ